MINQNQSAKNGMGGFFFRGLGGGLQGFVVINVDPPALVLVLVVLIVVVLVVVVVVMVILPSKNRVGTHSPIVLWTMAILEYPSRPINILSSHYICSLVIISMSSTWYRTSRSLKTFSFSLSPSSNSPLNCHINITI